MKIINFGMLSILGATLFAGCAMDTGAEPVDDDGADDASQASVRGVSADQAALEARPLDGRAAAAVMAKELGVTAAAASGSLTSQWFSGSVAAGGTQHWFWNNSSKTVAFKVGLSPTGASTTSACRFQVTRTWDVQQNTGEREFHFEIKNIGAIACGTNVLLTSQAAFTTWSTGGIAVGASQSWTWNNANPLSSTHLVGVSPTGSTSTDTCDIEVTRSFYLQQPSGEREFHFVLKNVGNIACQGDIQLANTTSADSSWSTGSLAPGASSSWVWNNANPLTRVYVPGLAPAGASTTTPCQLEITSTSYQQFINADGTTERKFNLTVKNIGSLTCSGRVLLNGLN
jgi:hypothetical protein